MCKRIACREFDRTRDTVQPLLKQFRRVGLGRAPYHRADRIIASPPPQRAGQPFSQDAEKVRQRRSRIVQTLNEQKRTSRMPESLKGLFRSPRSIRGANGSHEVRYVPPSALHSLRPCLRNGASWRAGVGRVRSLNFLSILRALQILLTILC